MAINFRKNVAELQDVISVDEAEGFLEWLQKTPVAQVDLKACAHMHAANLQVLMAAQPKVVAWPESQTFRAWLEPLLKP